MAKLLWDQEGTRQFEMGTDHGVLYKKDNTGAYGEGVAWNGLTAVTESPSGAEKTDFYADDIKYASMLSAEDFSATIEAYTYPEEFNECDGNYQLAPGAYAGQQSRRGFGFAYRTKIGNDATPLAGYKIHLVYGALASPSEKANTTINDSPEAITFSWEVTTTPVASEHLEKPAATLVLDSTEVAEAKMTAIEAILYGTEENEPRLPTIDEIYTLLNAA